MDAHLHLPGNRRGGAVRLERHLVTERPERDRERGQLELDIAANGGTVSVGFNGTDTGQDPAPTVLSVNGTACATN